MGKTFITSDLHFFHGNIIKYCPESRGSFSSVDDMHEAIINNINSMVTDDDTLIIAGDIGFASAGKICDLLKQVNGMKKLVWGNHDKKFRQTTEYQCQKKIMGVEWDGDVLDFKHKFEEKTYQILVCHFPFLTWDGQHHGSINLHGHCHSSFEKRNTQGPNVRQIDVGCDGNSMMPHDLDDVCSEMSRRQASFHGHHDGTR